MSRRLLGFLLPVVFAGALVSACTPPGGGGGTTTTTTSTTTSTTTTTVPKHVMSVGHADAFEVSVDGNALEVQIKDDSGPSVVWRDPAQTILHAKSESEITVPDPPGAFGFLGAGGDPAWLLPQAQDPNLLWPGASTERIGSGVLQGNTVDWTILSVSGPGGFHAFQVGAFGSPQMWFTTDSAFPQTQPLTVPVHAHYNWAFGAAGTYTVVMQADAALANGTPVTSGPVTYTFHVGDL